MTMFSNTKYETAKLFLNQIVMSFFGLVTALATSGSDVLSVICGILGIGLYVFLIYNMMWEIGGKDRIKVDAKRAEYSASKPLKMALIAGSLNLLSGLLCLFVLFDNDVMKSIAGVSETVCKLLLGHFLGIAREAKLLGNPFYWIGAAVFCILVAVVSYHLGYRNFKIFKKKKKEETPEK